MQRKYPTKLPRPCRKITVVKKALSKPQKKAVKNLIKASGEKDTFDTEIVSGTDITSTPLITDLCLVPQGDGQGERVGDRIEPYGLDMSVRVSYAGASAPNAKTAQPIRLLLVRWKPDNAQQNLTAMNSVITEGTDEVDQLFVNDDVLRRKFNVLWEQYFYLQSNAFTSGGDTYPTQRVFKKHLKLANVPIKYNAGQTTGSNKLFLIMVTAQATANAIESKAYIRLQYRDL